MPHLVIFQGKTEQFDEREHADDLVQLLKLHNVPYKYTVSEGKAQPKNHTCQECDLKYYTYQQAGECCKHS